MAATAEKIESAPPPALLPGQQGFLLLQEKWAMFILDTLADGPLGFNDISRIAACINPATLSNRLGRLEREGLVVKTVQSVMPPRGSYALSPAGSAVLPALQAIKDWADVHLVRPNLDCG